MNVATEVIVCVCDDDADDADADLQRVQQTAAGVAGVTHCVQGLPGEGCSALHVAAAFHFVHVGGNQEGRDALWK